MDNPLVYFTKTNLILNIYYKYLNLHSEKDLDKVNMGKRKEIYRQKMNKKIDALSKSNVKSLILYSYDMKTGKYKEIVNNFLGIKEVKQCQSVVNE